MSLDVWFKKDIHNLLLAIDLANGSTCAKLAPVAAESLASMYYRAGYADALSAVAKAFGICITLHSKQPLTLDLSLPTDLLEVNNGDDMSGV